MFPFKLVFIIITCLVISVRSMYLTTEPIARDSLLNEMIHDPWAEPDMKFVKIDRLFPICALITRVLVPTL